MFVFFQKRLLACFWDPNIFLRMLDTWPAINIQRNPNMIIPRPSLSTKHHLSKANQGLWSSQAQRGLQIIHPTPPFCRLGLSMVPSTGCSAQPEHRWPTIQDPQQQEANTCCSRSSFHGLNGALKSVSFLDLQGKVLLNKTCVLVWAWNCNRFGELQGWISKGFERGFTVVLVGLEWLDCTVVFNGPV